MLGDHRQVQGELGARFLLEVTRWQVNQFYTAPTAVRSLMSFGEQYPEGHSLKSLRVLGSVGEPINPEVTWDRAAASHLLPSIAR